MRTCSRAVFRAMSLVGIIPTLVGTFVLTRYVTTRIPPSSLPEHALFAFTFLSIALGGWLLRSTEHANEANAG